MTKNKYFLDEMNPRKLQLEYIDFAKQLKDNIRI